MLPVQRRDVGQRPVEPGRERLGPVVALGRLVGRRRTGTGTAASSWPPRPRSDEHRDDVLDHVLVDLGLVEVAQVAEQGHVAHAVLDEQLPLVGLGDALERAVLGVLPEPRLAPLPLTGERLQPGELGHRVPRSPCGANAWRSAIGIAFSVGPRLHLLAASPSVGQRRLPTPVTPVEQPAEQRRLLRRPSASRATARGRHPAASRRTRRRSAARSARLYVLRAASARPRLTGMGRLRPYRVGPVGQHLAGLVGTQAGRSDELTVEARSALASRRALTASQATRIDTERMLASVRSHVTKRSDPLGVFHRDGPGETRRAGSPGRWRSRRTSAPAWSTRRSCTARTGGRGRTRSRPHGSSSSRRSCRSAVAVPRLRTSP